MRGEMKKEREMKSYMYRQGDAFIVAIWDEAIKCYRESGAMPYGQARLRVGEANCPGARGGVCRAAMHIHP